MARHHFDLQKLANAILKSNQLELNLAYDKGFSKYPTEAWLSVGDHDHSFVGSAEVRALFRALARIDSAKEKSTNIELSVKGPHEYGAHFIGYFLMGEWTPSDGLGWFEPEEEEEEEEEDW